MWLNWHYLSLIIKLIIDKSEDIDLGQVEIILPKDLIGLVVVVSSYLNLFSFSIIA